jgi:hypothetical protein
MTCYSSPLHSSTCVGISCRTYGSGNFSSFFSIAMRIYPNIDNSGVLLSLFLLGSTKCFLFNFIPSICLTHFVYPYARGLSFQKIFTFLDVTPHYLVKTNRRFGEKFYLHFLSILTFRMKVNASSSAEHTIHYPRNLINIKNDSIKNNKSLFLRGGGGLGQVLYPTF